MVDELLGIAGLSLYVAAASTAIASLLGIPLGAFLALREEARGRRPSLTIAKAVVFTMYGMPPVLAGLLVYLLISNEGPLGALGLLFTPGGMILAQVLIVGGNIRGSTRTLTTSIVLETGRGNFAEAVGLGAFLLVIAFGIFLVLRRMQERGYR